MRRGPLTAGEKVQFTDRRSNKITDQLVPGGVTQTSHGIILHDDVIGQSEGSVVVTVSAKREAQINQDHPERDANKPWKGTRAIGGWQFAVMRPRLADYVLSMPRGAPDHVSEGHCPSDSAWRHSFRHERVGIRCRIRRHERQPAGRGGGAWKTDHHRDAFGIRPRGRSECHGLFRWAPRMVGSENR